MNNKGIVAWVALGLGVVALILGWVAFNRSGSNLGDEIVQNSRENTVELRQEWRRDLASLEARARLLVLQAQLSANRNYSAASDEIQDIRNNLRSAYANASANAKNGWQQVDQSLESTENKLREGSADALDSLEQAIDRLQAEVRVDESS